MIKPDELNLKLDTLEEALSDPRVSPQQNEETRARYKLIIDTSQDEAVLRLFLNYRKVQSKASIQCVMCSTFASDMATNKVSELWRTPSILSWCNVYPGCILRH